MQKKLFLIDAMALIYRAHFAFSKNPRINSKGMNTSAVLGFTNSLLDIINKEKPTHIGVAYDTHAPTFRHDVFPEYKANREKQPEDIQVAIPITKELVKAFNIPVLELDGYEADDIIGTIAKVAASQDFEVFMMTPDKDYAQLVSDHVYLYKPAYMGNSVDVLGIEEVLKKFDIHHVDQVRDLLGLQGDSVDNIPGIPGVGAKTAVKFIQEYGSVEELLKNTDSLKGKLKEKVEQFGEQAILSKELATINTEVPVPFNEPDFEYNGPDTEKLKPIFDDLEFRTLSRRVFGEQPITSSEDSGQLSMFGGGSEEESAQKDVVIKKTISDADHDYKLVDSEKDIKQLVGKLNKVPEFCFDTETTGVDAIEAELVGLAFSVKKGEAYYIPVPEKESSIRKIVSHFKEPLENTGIGKIGQNLKYDILVLKKYGVKVDGPLFDTMIAHYLIEPDSRHNMDILAENYLNYIPVSIETLIGKKGKKQGNMRDVEIDKVVEYAGEDADITLQLKEVFEPILKEKKLEKLFHEVEIPLIKVLADMEYAGVKIDRKTLANLSEEMDAEIVNLNQAIYDLAGTEFNIASPKQLGEILFEHLKLDDKPKKTKTGQYATGEEILTRLAYKHEIAQKILDYREVQKLKSTYIDALPEMISPGDDRVHTSFNQAIAATGRLSSTNPNLQNIPIRTAKGREVRKAFVPRDKDYILMSSDYSQIELRIMAHFAKDESMIKAFQDGKDIHSITASKIFQTGLSEVT
ncbi:MAG: DNA polymerase I, partial [Cyclobacteriaceae bacterium]